MKPLETSQLLQTWLYAFPHDNLASKQKRLAYFLFTVYVIVGHFSSVMSGAVFISEFISIDLEEAIFAMYHTIGCFNMLYQSIITVLLRRKLMAIFESLATIYDENENKDSYPILMLANQRCEWIWLFFIKFIMCATLVMNVTLTIVSVPFCYIIDGHFNPDHAYHAGNFMLPWDQSTLLGYFFELFFVIFITGAYLLTNGSIIILFISMCLHHRAFYEMFLVEVRMFDVRDKTRNDAEHLRKLISFHVSVIDWFLQTAEAFSAFILVVLISSMLYLSCVVFQLDLQMKHPNFGLATILMAIPYGISILFVYCYFGKMATESHENMAHALYECNWLDLSPNLQKYVVIMVENAQRSIFYHGFGLAVLNLETFSRMIRAVISFYMMFKTVTTG